VSIVVEHDKRKKDILEKALDVFIEDGYEDATFRKISERCGITRTILYLYFKNKREIFAFSIKQFLGHLEVGIRRIAAQPEQSAARKLEDIIVLVIRACSEQRRLLQVILDYLESMRKAGGDADERVKRRTIRMRHILSGLLIEGMRSGEFADAPVRDATDTFYALIESAIFRSVVLGRADPSDLERATALLVARLRKS